ncbi:hypothetical protein BH09VER1_BH09VER1_47340 [soil metagenome]
MAPEFFRPLTRPSAPIYVDCAQRLEEEAGLAGRLPLLDAQQFIREVLAAYPLTRFEEDEGALLRDARQRAGVFLNKLLAAGWVEEQTLGLQDRRIVITPGLRLLMGMLRTLVEDEVAELQTFADTLRGVCETLEHEAILDPIRQSPDEMRGSIHDLNQRLNLAVSQLYSVEKLIAGFESQQRQSESPAETLRVFYTEFSQGQHMVCYDVLSKGGLISRLRAARAKVGDSRDDPLVRQRLAEGLRTHYSYSESDSAVRANDDLLRLERSLGGLGEIARAIDERMASFNRLSQQRYRYQTEIRGRRPELVKAYCDALNSSNEGTHFRIFANAVPDFRPLCPEMRFLFGTEALWKMHKRRTPADLTFATGRATADDEAVALAALRERQRLALTPLRGAKLVCKFLSKKGTTAGTEDITVGHTDEMLDLLAIVAYDHAQDENGRMIRWQIDGQRRREGLFPENISRDAQLDWLVDRFQVNRTL